VIDEVQTVKAGQESARFHTHGGGSSPCGFGGRARPPDRSQGAQAPEAGARRHAHAAMAAIKTGIDRGELEDIVAEPSDQHVDLLGTGPVVHS
jgi:hypothetical protein